MGDAPRIPQTRAGAVAAAIIFNLVPLFGVLFWGWSVYALLLLYWLENVVIGGLNVAKMLTSGAAHGGGAILAALFFAAFFAFHYGMFTFGHGIFVNALFGGTHAESMFDLRGAVAAAFAQSPNLVWGFAAICALQLWGFVWFLVRGEAVRTDPMTLMSEPYGRIIILHFTIIFGGMLVLALGAPVWAIAVLVLVKIGVDVRDALPKKEKPAGGNSEGRFWRRVDRGAR